MSILERIPTEIAGISQNLFLDAKIFNMGDYYEILCPSANSKIVATWLLRNVSANIIYTTRIPQNQ
jgi:hypothetical protein